MHLKLHFFSSVEKTESFLSQNNKKKKQKMLVCIYLLLQLFNYDIKKKIKNKENEFKISY